MEVSFVVHGKPATAGSKTVFSYQRDGQTHVGVRPANQRQKPFMAAVAAEAAEAAGDIFWDREPLGLSVTIVSVRPRSHFGTGKNASVIKPRAVDLLPTGKPDSLKVTRAIEDAMKGVLYRDDSQICAHVIYKAYGDSDYVLVTVGALR